MMIGNDIEPSLSLCIIKVKRTIFKRKLPDWDWDYELVKRKVRDLDPVLPRQCPP